MKRFTKSVLAMMLTALAAPSWVTAQTVLTLPQTGKADGDAPANPQKAEPKKQLAAEEAAKDFTCPWPLSSESDRMAYGSFVAEKGQKPAAPMFNVKKASDENTQYTYTGFNQTAGVAADGTTATGGLVDFNLQPFACDTVSSDAGLSPYSYMAKGKLYSFIPNYDQATGLYSTLTRTVYDANTLVKLDQKTFDNPYGSVDRMPYIIAYDDYRDVVYAISMGQVSNNVQPYYLNIIDTATCQLQRLGKIGEWSGYKTKGNFSPKGFTATGGTLRIEVADDSIYIEEIDPLTLERKVIGRTEMPTQYVYGLQPMIYDSNSGSLTINHFDFNNGTIYYKVQPFLAYGATDNILKTEVIEKTPTGFTYFYKRPEMETSYFKYTLADISDLSVSVPDGSNTATITFTVPDKDTEGNAIDVPSWSTTNVTCNVYIDNSAANVNDLPATINLGDKVTASVDLTDGLHTVTVQLSPSYSDVKQTRSSKTLTVGYDAPEAVSSPALTVKDMVATISWKAPTRGKYADFGSNFDGSDITYKVVRNTDGKVIADGISETTVTDNNMPEEIQTYSYTIYATSHGSQSFAAVTNEVSAGQYLPLPYTNDFSDSHSIDGWTVIDNDTPGTIKTWTWNSYYGFLRTGFGIGDDWAITPPFKLNSDKVYSLRYDLTGSGNLRTTVGKGITADEQSEILDDAKNYKAKKNPDYETKEYYFRPSENGYYNFGFYNYSLGENDSWAVDNLKVEEVASANAPDKVRSLAFTPDANGALGGTLTFKLPATDIAGNSISKLTKVVVYDLVSGKEISTLTNVTPGAVGSVKVTADHGFNTYKVVAANDNGEGWPTLIQKFVGLDKPKSISNLKLSWGEEQNIIHLTWDAPTEGVDGGYVNPADFNYTLYKYTNSYPPYTKIAETPETDVDMTLLGIPEDQDQYIIGITVSNDAGESDYVRSSIVLGTPYELPFTEPFDAKGINHQPYIIQAMKNSQAWTTDLGVFNDKIQPQNEDGLQLLLRNTGITDGSSRFISPIIDFTNAKTPALSVWLHHSDAMPEEAYVTIDANTDGSSDYIAVSDTARLTGNNGWTEHIFDLSKLKGKKAQIGVTGYTPNPATRIFMDNWNIYDLSGKDLALAAISQPYMPVVGDTATVTVTVTNRGAEAAQGYSVLFNVNGETVASAEPDEALALGKSATFNFTLPITAAKKEIIYSASVEYDGDENLDNNESSEVELSPKQVELPAPTGLALNGATSLVWNVPETMDGRTVTLDFEDVPAFTIDNIDGWKTVDGDGNLTTSFVQYYGNYWPYANQPFAWMTWSIREAGCPSASMWAAHSGEKCIINFCNYGADAEGRPSTKPNDDWFISPEVKGGTEFSLWSLTQDASSSIEVLASTTDDKPESFTETVGTVTYSATATWSEYKFTLPADAKYVALHNVTNGFGLLVDDITYTEAKAPALKGYNVYRDNSGIAQAKDTNAEAKYNGTYAVSAVYDLGESELSNTVSVTSAGITDATVSTANVKGGKGFLTITGAQGDKFYVFNVSGMRLASDVAADTETVNVPAGIYLVKTAGKTFKVTVK